MGGRDDRGQVVGVGGVGERDRLGLGWRDLESATGWGAGVGMEGGDAGSSGMWCCIDLPEKGVEASKGFNACCGKTCAEQEKAMMEHF